MAGVKKGDKPLPRSSAFRFVHFESRHADVHSGRCRTINPRSFNGR